MAFSARRFHRRNEGAEQTLVRRAGVRIGPSGSGEYLVTLLLGNASGAAPSSSSRSSARGADCLEHHLRSGDGDRQWTEADIEKALARPDGTLTQGAMQSCQAGRATLEDKDVSAIAAFIETIPAEK